VWVGVYSFLTSALDRGECSAWWLGHLPSEKRPRSHVNRQLAGPWIRSGRCRDEVQLLPLMAYEPLIVQPLAYSLYFLRYLGIILHNFLPQSAKPSASFYLAIHLNSDVSIQCHYFNHQPHPSRSLNNKNPHASSFPHCLPEMLWGNQASLQLLCVFLYYTRFKDGCHMKSVVNS